MYKVESDKEEEARTAEMRAKMEEQMKHAQVEHDKAKAGQAGQAEQAGEPVPDDGAEEDMKEDL